jgi:hypothetical protein
LRLLFDFRRPWHSSIATPKRREKDIIIMQGTPKLVIPGQQQSAPQLQFAPQQPVGESVLPMHVGDPGTFGGKTALRLRPTMEAYLYAPYASRGDFTWAPFLRSLGAELLHSYMLCWVVSTVASISTSSSGALNAVMVGLAYGGYLAFAYGKRCLDE